MRSGSRLRDAEQGLLGAPGDGHIRDDVEPRDIWAIWFYLDEHGRLRDRALFDLAIDSKLRGYHLVKVKIGDVVSGGSIRNRSTVIQQKTGKPVQFEIMSEARKSLTAWLERRRGTIHDFLFPSRVDYLGHLSTRQYARLADEWVSTVGLDQREYGTHSLRRTKASLLCKATGNLRAVQIPSGPIVLATAVDIALRARGRGPSPLSGRCRSKGAVGSAPSH